MQGEAGALPGLRGESRPRPIRLAPSSSLRGPTPSEPARSNLAAPPLTIALPILEGRSGPSALAAWLIYACGLRLTEVRQLRIKGIDFDRKEIVIRRGYDLRTIQELPGHADVSTTTIYTRVLNRGARSVESRYELLPPQSLSKYTAKATLRLTLGAGPGFNPFGGMA